MAIMFQNNPFYLPVYLDFRGRIYSEVTYLSYQGSDIIRSLINFYNSDLINDDGIKYLKIYASNVYGLSNKIFKVRIE